MGTKECYTCKRVLPLKNFGVRYSSKDGRAHWCLECARDYHKRYRKENPEVIRAIQNRYRENNHDAYLEYQRYAYQSRKRILASPDGIE